MPRPTNLAIDDSLLEKARRIGKFLTEKGNVTVALEEFIQRRRQRQLLKSLDILDFRKEGLELQGGSRAP